MFMIIPMEEIPIEGIGFYTNNVDGEWEFTDYDDGSMDISVPNVYSHSFASVLTSGHSLLFKVRAREDARVMLMEVKAYYW